jgi:U3 small nucleolar RNA-associated protein 11
VHIKDRGNVALPVDIVKVLKTQDENYIRTMRSSGLKVSMRPSPENIFPA